MSLYLVVVAIGGGNMAMIERIFCHVPVRVGIRCASIRSIVLFALKEVFFFWV